jgi:arylsulfatase A-like enzyme
MLWLSIVWACRTDEVAPTPAPPRAPLIRFDGAPPKNVLMISLDTFRRDKLQRYGGPGIMPFLEGLMEESVVADDHIQCSNWTWHSTSCTLAGRYAEDVGYLPKLDNSAPPIPEGQRTLARILHDDHGYATALASNNRWLGPKVGNAQGYQIVNPPGPGFAVDMVRRATLGVDLAQLDGGGESWLAHAHVLEAHAPYIPPVEYRVGVDELEPLPFPIDSQGAHYFAAALWPELTDDERLLLQQHLTLRYEGELRWIDAMLELAFVELDAEGRLDDTLVVVWTDHGEAFWEHGVQTHAHHLYAEENDAVLFFWAKNIVPASWSETTHAVDMLPTILDALELPPEPGLPGAVLGMGDPSRPLFVTAAARQGVVQSVVSDGWKLIYSWEDDTLELFDREHDREETTDWLPSIEGQRVADELWQQLEPRVTLAEPLTDASNGE